MQKVIFFHPSLLVKYRIFTLDHTFRPLQEVVQISVFVSRSHLT